jgi:hypothetical protein
MALNVTLDTRARRRRAAISSARAGVLASALWIVQLQAAWAAPARSARPDVVPILLVFALISGVVFGAIAIWCFYSAGRKTDAAGARTLWRVARGQILDSHVEARSLHQGGSYYEPVVRYAYAVSGRQYFGDVVEIDATPARQSSAAERVIARYRPGASVNVRYNPDNPHEAELVGSSSAASWGGALSITMGGLAAMALLFFVVALLLRVGGII